MIGSEGVIFLAEEIFFKEIGDILQKQNIINGLYKHEIPPGLANC